METQKESGERVTEIYSKIIDRFPVGRMSAYIKGCLDGGREPDKEEIIHELVLISHGMDSELRYIDESSKITASHFITRLRRGDK